MTKILLLIAALCLGGLPFSGCVSTSVSKEIASRAKLFEKESFRTQLPKHENPLVRPNFPRVHQRVLSNGLTVLVSEDKSLPIAQVLIAFKNGSAFDPPNKAGLINLTSLMLKEGTAKLSSLELAEDFANLGTEMSVSATKDVVSLSAAVLSNKFDDALALLAAIVESPRFMEEDFKRVKLQQQSAIASDHADPSYLAQVKFLRAAYGDKHPYSYPSAGTSSSVAGIKLDDIKETYSQNFGPNNAVVVVVGDVDMNQVMQAVNKYFATWKKIKEPELAIALPKLNKKMQTVLVDVPHTPQTYLLLGQPVAARDDKNLASFEVLLSILARDPTSRLNASLREQKGWTYGVKGSVSPLRGLGPLFITSSIQAPFGSDALQEILKEIQQLKDQPVSDEELKQAKEGILHSFANRYSTIGKIASQISEKFAYGLPLNNDEVLYDNLAKVSQSDIMSVAARALKKEHMVAVAVGELEVMRTPLKKMDVGVVTVDQEKMNLRAKH